MLLKINLNNLVDSQTSLAKNILLYDRSIIEEKNVDLDNNIKEYEFDYEFLSN